MRLSKYSDGIAKVDGKKYQTADHHAIMFVCRCPYCNHEHDDKTDEIIITCDNCKREFVGGSIRY